MTKCSQCVNYWAACEWNAQSRNESHLCQKRTKWWMELQENFACPTLASWGWFLRGGEGHLANRIGSWFGMNTKLLRGVIGPIFSLNDYLNTVFDNVVGPRGSCKIILPREKFDLKIFRSHSKPKDTYCLKVPITQNFLFSYLKLHLIKITSAKKFCDLSQRWFF